MHGRVAILFVVAAALGAWGLACHEGGETDPCDGVDCSGHGVCQSIDDTRAVCDCDSGYRASGLACVPDGGDGDADGDGDAGPDGDGDTDTDSDGDVDAETDEEPDSDPGELDTVVADAAAAVCRALFRCCNSDDRASFFYKTFYSHAELVGAGYQSRMPPACAGAVTEEGCSEPLRLDLASCTAIVEEMLELVPFGRWVEAARGGLVTYAREEARACLAALDAAACGAEVVAALTDSTCFALPPPELPAERRRMFSRSSGSGDDCVVLNDGNGGELYGTCDPQRAFCCRTTAGDCSLDGPDEGTCEEVAPLGGECGSLEAGRVCAAGAHCELVARECEENATTSLSVGQTCYALFGHLGRCVDSYCEIVYEGEPFPVLTGTCVPLRGSGESCSSDGQCRSGSCVYEFAWRPDTGGPVLDATGRCSGGYCDGP